MKELVEYIVKGLVDRPDEVAVSENRRGGDVALQLHVSADDMGRVIGKGGKVANALRALLRAMAAKDNLRVTLDID